MKKEQFGLVIKRLDLFGHIVLIIKKPILAQHEIKETTMPVIKSKTIKKPLAKSKSKKK